MSKILTSSSRTNLWLIISCRHVWRGVNLGFGGSVSTLKSQSRVWIRLRLRLHHDFTFVFIISSSINVWLFKVVPHLTFTVLPCDIYTGQLPYGQLCSLRKCLACFRLGSWPLIRVPVEKRNNYRISFHCTPWLGTFQWHSVGVEYVSELDTETERER